MLLPLALAFAQDPTIPYEEYTLPNGLEVILSPDRSVPFVWVHAWYEVGSKDEAPGRSGFAHLFEHLMFQGSEHMNDDYFQPLQKIGGQVNGTTNLDRTVYFEGVPSAYLPLALFLESDRMGWLLPALDEAKLQNQKDVVRNERRQRYETPPYGEAWPKLLESVWPAGHPYHIATIGKHEDLEAARLEEAKDFFRQWYLPNNASLAIVGDFDPAEAKRLVELYFGEIPAGPEPRVTTATAPKLEGTKRVVVEKAVPFPKVWVAWVSPALYAPGDAELDLLASILTDGDDSRLTRRLVREERIAQDVSAYQTSNRLGSMFVIEATAASGHTVDELVASIDDELAKLRASGVSADELDLVRTGWEVSFYGRISTIQGKAEALNGYNMVTGTPGYLSQDLARYRAATPATVSDALRTWVPADSRVVLSFVPPAAAETR